jgi:hypothetical protein
MKKLMQVVKTPDEIFDQYLCAVVQGMLANRFIVGGSRFLEMDSAVSMVQEMMRRRNEVLQQPGFKTVNT